MKRKHQQQPPYNMHLLVGECYEVVDLGHDLTCAHSSGQFELRPSSDGASTANSLQLQYCYAH